MAEPKPWEKYAAAPTSAPLAPGSLGGLFIPKPVDPIQAANDQAGLTGKSMDNRITAATLPAVVRKTNAEADIAEGKRGDTKLDNTMKLRSAFDGQQSVKDYRSAIPQVTAGLRTANTPSGDNALIYSYAKVMDPGSAVKEGEAAAVANSDTIFGKAYAYAKKQITGDGTFSPEARAGLRREMINRTVELNRAYESERERYSADAQAFNLDPARIIGPHSGAKFLPEIQSYAKSQRPEQAGKSQAFDPATGRATTTTVYDPTNGQDPGGPPPVEVEIVGGGVEPKGYEASYVGQGLSGFNEGLAAIGGAPVDLMTGALNLGSRGINALTNGDIPLIERPTLGSEWIKDNILSPTIFEQTSDPSKQFLRRVGESVGAAAVPAGAAGSMARGGGQLIAGALGGVGGATAQQVFPGNPLAEMTAELLAGGAGATGLMKYSQRGAQRAIEAAVPTSEQLREQATALYQQAEQNGITANGAQTQGLADTIRQTLAQEGHVSPTGRISEVYPKARQALQLVDDYAGQPMNPTQMQTVRKIAADGLSSPDATERRLGRLLTGNVDDFAAPLAPELAQARGVSRRYLVSDELEEARELAGARAGQFSGSGFENALRTDYRALDRAQVKGQKQFPDEVTEQIRNVARGTTGSNIARGIGRLAPTTPMAFGMGSGLPALITGLGTGSPAAGGAALLAMTGIGAAGRGVATSMGMNAARIAELTARNGGSLAQARFVTPEIMRALRLLGSAEAAKYLTSEDDEAGADQNGNRNPNPLAGGKHQRPLAPPPGTLAPFFR